MPNPPSTRRKRRLDALDQGKKDDALAALERVTGKLDLILARDPKLALAPVSVATVVRDLYANQDTVKAAIKEARSDLNDGKVQQAARCSAAWRAKRNCK